MAGLLTGVVISLSSILQHFAQLWGRGALAGRMIGAVFWVHVMGFYQSNGSIWKVRCAQWRIMSCRWILKARRYGRM